MSERQKYLFDYLSVMVAQGISALRPLVMILFVTNHLGKADYGVWSQTLVTSLFLAPLLALRMPSLLPRFFSGCRSNEHLAAAYGGAILIASFLGATLLAAAYLGSGMCSRFLFGSQRHMASLMPAAGYCVAQSIFLLSISYFTVSGRQRVYASVSALWAVGEMALMAVLTFHCAMADIILAVAGWQAILAIAVIGHVFRRLGLSRPRLPRTGEFWRFGAWLVLSHVVFFWAGNAHRYVLVAFGGIEVVGVFTVAHSVAQLVSLVTAPNITVLLPSISAHWNAGRSEQARPLIALAYALVMVLGLPIVSGLYVYGNTIIEILSHRSYTVASWLPPFLALASLSYGVFNVSVYASWMQKRMGMAILVQLGGIAANLLASVLLVRTLGLVGAALASVISMLVMSGGMYLLARQVFGVGIDWVHVLRCLLASLLMLAAMLAWSRVPLRPWLSLLTGSVVGVLVYGAAGLTVGAIPAEQFRKMADVFRRRVATAWP